MGEKRESPGHLKELLYFILFVFALFLLNPIFDYFEFENEIIKQAFTLIIIVLAFLIIDHISLPNIKCSFHSKRREVILVGDSPSRRAVNLNLYIDRNFSFLTRKMFNFSCKKYSDKLFYQIYWHPREAINIDLNYSSITYIEEYPSFSINSLSEINLYSLKIISGNRPECTKISVIIQRKCSTDSNLFARMLFFFIKLRSEKLTVRSE